MVWKETESKAILQGASIPLYKALLDKSYQSSQASMPKVRTTWSKFGILEFALNTKFVAALLQNYFSGAKIKILTWLERRDD